VQPMRPVADDDGWEARMAERAQGRDVVREAEAITRADADLDPGDFADNPPFEIATGCPAVVGPTTVVDSWVLRLGGE
jgi:hypothetical protein